MKVHASTSTDQTTTTDILVTARTVKATVRKVSPKDHFDNCIEGPSNCSMISQAAERVHISIAKVSRPVGAV